jgi:peptidoglycan/LPS O-acetylase OafA/YrhL
MTAVSTLRAPAQNMIPSLNGIRALAVMLVFFAHSGLGNRVPGGLGVTIFFVLSGFLITTLIRVEFDGTRRINYRAFYLRRLLRLMPPLFIIVAIAAPLSSFEIINGQFSVGGLFSTLFYFGNYYVIAQDFHGVPDGLGVVWSLAVEEHYYLLYPPLAALLLRIGRREVTAGVLGALCLGILLWRYWLAYHGASEAYLTMATDARADAILVGCLLAMRWNPTLDPVRAPGHLRDWVTIGLCALVLLGTLVYRDEVFRLTLRNTLQSAAIAPLLFLSVARSGWWPFRWLNARPMAYLGSISYTVYLSHHLVLEGLVKHWPEMQWLWLTAIAGMVTLIVAEVMRRCVEVPCARMRRRLHQDHPSSEGLPALTPLGLR